MTDSTPSRPKLALVNSLGALGYMSIILQWMWSLLLYAPYILTDSVQNLLLPPEQPEQPAPTPTAVTDEPSIFLIILMLAITGLVLAVTVYIALKAPSAVGKAGKKVATSAAKATLPLVAKQQPLKKEQRQRLTARLIVLFKIAFIALPLIVVLPTQWLSDLPLDHVIVLIVATSTALSSTILIGLQYLTARLLHIPAKNLW